MSTPDIAEARTQFDYLLNAYTAAAQADKPAEHDYKVKREALFAYVRETERAARNQAAEVERLRSAVHSCGPTCDKAGCVNARLTQELERLRAQVAPDGWKLVPVEMTDEMRDAGNEVVGNRYLLSRAYAAMLAASPAAPAQQDTTAPAGRARLAESGGSRACAVVPAPAQQAEPCDMGEICIGCQPRAVDGGCPHAEQAPSLTVGDEPRPPSPTAGMTLAQRILHVGGRNNAAGYVEFGSTQAVQALVHQVLRDLPDGGVPAEPNDWRLPADLKAGHVTFRKGVHCSALVSRMKMLHETAFGVDNLTPEQKAANLAALQAGEPLPHGFLSSQPAAQGVEVPAGLARSDAEFWLRHRAAIIDACERAGLTIVTTASGVELWLRKHLRAALAQAPAAEPQAVVSAYRIGDGINAVKVERVQQMEGPDLWAVRRHAEVLSKEGAWEWEPMPSSRDDDFLARCRFSTSDDAIAAAVAAAATA